MYLGREAEAHHPADMYNQMADRSLKTGPEYVPKYLTLVHILTPNKTVPWVRVPEGPPHNFPY